MKLQLTLQRSFVVPDVPGGSPLYTSPYLLPALMAAYDQEKEPGTFAPNTYDALQALSPATGVYNLTHSDPVFGGLVIIGPNDTLISPRVSRVFHRVALGMTAQRLVSPPSGQFDAVSRTPLTRIFEDDGVDGLTYLRPFDDGAYAQIFPSFNAAVLADGSEQTQRANYRNTRRMYGSIWDGIYDSMEVIQSQNALQQFEWLSRTIGFTPLPFTGAGYHVERQGMFSSSFFIDLEVPQTVLGGGIDNLYILWCNQPWTEFTANVRNASADMPNATNGPTVEGFKVNPVKQMQYIRLDLTAPDSFSGGISGITAASLGALPIIMRNDVYISTLTSPWGFVPNFSSKVLLT